MRNVFWLFVLLVAVIVCMLVTGLGVDIYKSPDAPVPATSGK